MVKKSFFREPTKSQIKSKRFVEVEKISDIEQLSNDEFTIIPSLISPEYGSARKFMKHGPEVKLRRVYSLEQAVSLGKTPVQLREEMFDSINSNIFCGYSFMPLGKDKRKRKVSLIECLEGARIFAYVYQMNTKIDIKKIYSDSKRVKSEGAEVSIEVPSRTFNGRRIPIKLSSIPIVDCPEKYWIANNFLSDHSCPSKRFNIRYKYFDDKESSKIFNVCAHEITGTLELVQKEWADNKNIIPLQMCQFAIPTQRTVDYYLKLERNILVKDESLETKDKLRKPNRADKEIALWDFVKSFGHDETFYSKESRDGDVNNYNWV